jgi:hypothetical protein
MLLHKCGVRVLFLSLFHARPALADTAAGGHIGGMLHMLKLAAGIRDVPHLQAVQAARLARDPPLRTQTCNSPRRAAEVVDGGSIYWVISGSILVRQRIVAIGPDRWDDGTACAGLQLDPVLVPVQGRPTRPFQGWRYLEPEAAPADLVEAVGAAGVEALPDAMRRDLQALGLL